MQWEFVWSALCEHLWYENIDEHPSADFSCSSAVLLNNSHWFVKWLWVKRGNKLFPKQCLMSKPAGTGWMQVLAWCRFGMSVYKLLPGLSWHWASQPFLWQSVPHLNGISFSLSPSSTAALQVQFRVEICMHKWELLPNPQFRLGTWFHLSYM